MKLELVPCVSPPEHLRQRYFNSLPEPQVHYLERRVAASSAFCFGDVEPEKAGYLAVHDGAVVEFFAGEGWLPNLNEAFYAAAEQAGATSAVVKTYDAHMLAAATGRPAQLTTIGVNCTTWVDERFDPPPGFRSRPGDPSDQDLLAAIGPGLFETPDEISDDLHAGRILIYELKADPIGCGVVSRVSQGSGAFDIGMGVLPAWRRKGFGELIIRHLKVRCLRELGGRPVCGCAVENTASRRTLERAGFLTKHRLLEFNWDRG